MANGDPTPPPASPLTAAPWSTRYTWLIYPIAVLCIIFRAPDRLFNPQLWAEDGHIFLIGSVHEGFGSLFDAYAGYLHLLLRVVALPGRWLPLEWIPTFYYLGSIALVLLGMRLIQGSRHHLPAKPLLALCIPFVIFPGATMLNLTNTQWFLAPALPFLLLQASAITRRQAVWDAILILSLGLTGPFIILWLPLLALRPFIHSFRRSDLAIYLPALITATVQLILLLNNGRIGGADDADPTTTTATATALSLIDLFKATAGHPNAFFFFGSLAIYAPIVFGIIGTCISAWLLWLVVRLPRPLCLLSLGLLGAGFAVVLAGASGSTHESIQFMWPGNAGERYYVPLFILATQVLVLLAFHSRSANLIPFRIVLITVALSIISTFTLAPLKDLKWAERVHKATHLEGESRVRIPPYEFWDIRVYPPSPLPSRPLLAKDYTVKKSKPRSKTNTDKSTPEESASP